MLRELLRRTDHLALVPRVLQRPRTTAIPSGFILDPGGMRSRNLPVESRDIIRRGIPGFESPVIKTSFEGAKPKNKTKAVREKTESSNTWNEVSSKLLSSLYDKIFILFP